jgi:hypothetical protein
MKSFNESSVRIVTYANPPYKPPDTSGSCTPVRSVNWRAIQPAASPWARLHLQIFAKR